MCSQYQYLQDCGGLNDFCGSLMQLKMCDFHDSIGTQFKSLQLRASQSNTGTVILVKLLLHFKSGWRRVMCRTESRRFTTLLYYLTGTAVTSDASKLPVSQDSY